MKEAIATVDKIYDSIKERIITNELKPGQVLAESTLAAEYSVSRTPIREAVKKLTQDGFVSTLPKLGVQVSNISIHEVRERLEIRKALELLVARLAFRRVREADIAELRALNRRCMEANDAIAAVVADGEFHRKMWEIAGNQLLVRELEAIQCHDRRWWYYLHQAKPGLHFFDGSGGSTPFESIAKAFEERNEAALYEAVESHLDYYVEQMRSELL